MRNRTEAPGQGDEFDVATFIRENDRRLRRRVARCIGSRGGELDDVMQTTYVQLWQAASRIESVAQARGYCVLAAANIARDNARRRTPIPVDLSPEAAGLAPDPADLVVQREAVKILAAAVLALTPEQRSVWVSRELHGLTYAAIGSKLSLSPAAVRGLLERARAAVQRNVLAAEALVRDGYQAIVIHVVTARATMSPRPRGGSWSQAVLVAPAVVLAAATAPSMSGVVREHPRAEATLPQPAPPRTSATSSPVADVYGPELGRGKDDSSAMGIHGVPQKAVIGAIDDLPPSDDGSCLAVVGTVDCSGPTDPPGSNPPRPPGPVPSPPPVDLPHTSTEIVPLD